jgi:hypothetical protein
MVGVALGAKPLAALAGAAFAFGLTACGHLRAPVPVQADTFMQAVVHRDAEHGWQQLCPAARDQLPLALVQDQAAAQRAAEADRGLSLSLDYVGARPTPDGGEIRLYLVVAHFPEGKDERRTYTIHTQASGCVDSVE